MSNADKIASKTGQCCKGHLRKSKPKQPLRKLRRTLERREWQKDQDTNN